MILFVQGPQLQNIHTEHFTTVSDKIIYSELIAQGGLEPWQLRCREELHKLYAHCYSARTSIVAVVQGLPMPVDFAEAERELTQVGQCAMGWDAEEARNYATLTLRTGCVNGNLAIQQEGLVNTTAYHWRVDAASLWRGLSDPQKVCGIARSLLSVGFDLSEPICARDGTFGYQSLKFGDGQKRGLALRLAWCAFRKLCSELGFNPAAATQYPNMQKIFKSLTQVPALLPSAADSQDLRGCLVQQALRQNTKAVMTVPMNTIEWARLIIFSSNATCDADPQEVLAAVDEAARLATGKKLLGVMNLVVTGYKAKLDEAAVDMGPAVKRARKGRRAPKAAASNASGGHQPVQDESDTSMQIGSLRLAALKNILMHATPTSFKIMEQHLAFAGNAKYSALSDAALASKFIWPGSSPPPEYQPSEAMEAARRANAKFAMGMVPKALKSMPLDYESPLTIAEHECLIQKAIHIFEDECLHLADMSHRTKVRPDVLQFCEYRFICSQWLRTIQPRAQADLSPQDLVEVTNAVGFGDALDVQIRSCLIPQYPCLFHMAMLPDLKASMPEDAIPSEESLIEEAEKQVWLAKLTEFKSKLVSDQKLVKTVKAGSESLADHIDWLRHMKRLVEAGKAEQLVKRYTDLFFPVFEPAQWDELAGAYALMSKMQLPFQAADAKPYTIVVLDFNVPNTRDALVLKKLIAAVANLIKTTDVSRSMVFAFLATRPKEDSLDDLLEDEATLVKSMRGHGLKVTQRIRMALNPPNENSSSANAWDFWQDARVFYHYE